MKRVVGIARGRAGRVGLVAGVIVAAVVGLSAPAFAHHSDASGQTSCSDGAHVVTWTITNSESNQKMSIDSATAAIGAQSYAVSGYANPVGFSGSTTATSTVPGGTSGTIVLSVHVSWPDHFTYTAQASVNLLSNCGTTTTQATTTTAATTTTEATTTTTTHDNRCDGNHPGDGTDIDNGHNQSCDTTTTTQPEVTTTTQHGCECSTTTQPEVTTTTTHQCECTTSTTQPVTTTTDGTTTTTQPVTTTTEIHELGSTTIVTTTTKPKPHASTTVAAQASTVPTTQATPITGVLPHTGSSTTFPVIFGGMCLAAGAALALRKRSAWSRS